MAEFRIFILFQYRVGILQSDQPHPSLKFHMIIARQPELKLRIPRQNFCFTTAHVYSVF